MVKLLSMLTATILLSGCALFGPREVDIVTETIEVQVPLLYCPAPPVIVRPELPIHNMTPAQRASDGEIAKHWKATVRILIDHSNNQQKALDEYNNVNTSYEELRQRLQKIDDSTSKQ